MAKSLIEAASVMQPLSAKPTGVSGSDDASQFPSPCVLSPRDETRRIFVDVVQKQLINLGVRPVPRPVFRKVHGVAKAILDIDTRIPGRFRHGILAQRSFPAWVRFSSDTSPTTPDSANSTIGIGIKLFGVDCRTLDEDDPDAGTADLVMQNHDRFFVDTGEEFCAFSNAAVSGDFDGFLASHPETKVVLGEMAKSQTSVLSATYWSVLPYACGPEAVIKYRLQPIGLVEENSASATNPDELRADLANRLVKSAAVFEFAIQPFTTDADTPIDAATRRWMTPFETVGTLTIEAQDITQLGQAPYGENLSMNPWRVPKANRPLGSIADSRRITYRASAFQRRTANGIPNVEPRKPR
ncbi:hypothetical protein LJR245_007473 [Rhizobium leguminosarum]|uniref:hypothetical protein n=1 Tax=Rhizobium leguminosarum TaxID=384 RepID=UPI003ECCEFC1